MVWRIQKEAIHLCSDFFHSIRFKVNKGWARRSPFFIPLLIGIFNGMEKLHGLYNFRYEFITLLFRISILSVTETIRSYEEKGSSIKY